MTRGLLRAWATAAVVLSAHAAWAQSAADTRRSGFEDMRPATQAMQRDDTQNPGMLWAADGEALFQRAPLPHSKACIACHTTASLKGVAARYPAFDATLGRPVTLSHRINLCRERHQQAPALAPESQPLLGLETFVAHQARGEPIAPSADPRLAPFRARGEALYKQRIGQINLSCAQCHDERAGLRLAGSTIPQGHATGYPIYRLEWQGMGSLARRLRGCMTGVRAEPLAAHSVEMAELEVYLATRAAGMRLETPAVRP
jgi:L-cysteine S-thiosulfotransferase